MARSSRIIIIFVVIALILGIGCLFLIDYLQRGSEFTVRGDYNYEKKNN